ncbi:GGDEF domain-containing protein [Arsenicicoccus piscis]|uniref:GGDEF domain-containing protein n=1 Tax=Arsenicicoccus piscis TaxID=673954 RepID=A0ABQ6HR80_9MICO|nr:GGDEF domain-containing protein [Arsenicicoccus piscis]GMA19984.1 hypothetical protein GCM10025862_20050 [Arsenicicoccus piscis]
MSVAIVTVLAGSHLLTVVAAYVGVRRHLTRRGWAWALLAAGLLLAAAGTLVKWTLFLPGAFKPGPVTLVLPVAGHLIYVAALVAWTRHSGNHVTLERVLDGLFVMVVLLTLCWVMVVDPARAGGVAPSEVPVYLLFPVLDLLLLGCVTVMLSEVVFGSAAGLMIVVAASTLFFSDLAGGRDLASGLPVGLPVAALAVASNVAFAVALLLEPPEAEQHPTTTPADKVVRRRLALLTVLGVVPVVLLVVEVSRSRLVQDAEIDLLDIQVLSGSMIVLLAVAFSRVARMVSTAESLSSDLASLARSDHLTALPNRRSGDAELGRAIDAAAVTGETLAVALLDLDRFKAFNDQFGHHAGDELLVSSAQAWQSCLGVGQVLARYGGEEFLLVCSDMPASSVAEVIDRMRGFTPHGQNFSAGVAVWDGTESATQLVSRADDALYEAKESGRGCTRLSYTGREATPLETVARPRPMPATGRPSFEDLP